MPRGAKPGQRFGGRQKGTPNKSTRDIRAIAQQYGAEVLAKYVEFMRGTDTDLAFRAMQELMNRGFGKAAQAVNIGGPDGEPLEFGTLNDAQLDQLANRLEQALATAEGPLSADSREGAPTQH